jgi:large subunit ribosomal protein L18
MATGPRTRVPFRRRREGRTDYRKRLGLLKSAKTRVVVRRTSGNVIVQFVDWAETGDEIKATAVGRELRALGWNGSPKNTSAAYLTGLLAGKRARDRGIDAAVLDIGRHAPVRGGKVFAALKGVIDAGVDVPVGDDAVFPKAERLDGSILKQEKDFNAVRAKIGVGAANSTEEEE